MFTMLVKKLNQLFSPDKDTKQTCPVCKGSKSITVWGSKIGSCLIGESYTCDTCNGTGVVNIGKSK